MTRLRFTLALLSAGTAGVLLARTAVRMSHAWFLGSLGMPEPQPFAANDLEQILIAMGLYQAVTLLGVLTSFLVLTWAIILLRERYHPTPEPLPFTEELPCLPDSATGCSDALQV